MTRKYRQAGYQDGERPARAEGAGRADRPAVSRPPQDRLRPDRPKGRGLGAPSAERFRCAVCGAQQAPPTGEETAAACAACGAPTHTCTNCRHFDSAARFECRLPIPVRVLGKAKANECPLFEAKVAVEHEAEKAEPSDARSAFDSLFKGL